MILAEQNKTEKNADQLHRFDSKNAEQADFSLLHSLTEKAFQKRASHTAHEIRNPLSAMELHSKIISKRIDSLSEESITSIKCSIDCIINSIEVLKSITDGLKDYSDDIKINIKTNDITSTVAKVIDIIRPTFLEKNVDIAFHQSEQIMCKFDKNKTQQIIFNLLKNALESSKEGDKVDIYFAKENQQVSVRVKDTGCGVSERNIEKIFFPKFTTKKTGSGIGLCESRKIARAQNGDVNLVLTGQNGSVFELKMQA